MTWEELNSDDALVILNVEREFLWMRRFAFLYGVKCLRSEDAAADCTQRTLEMFIRRLESKGELNRAYFKKLTRYSIWDSFRRNRSDAMSHTVPDHASFDCEDPGNDLLSNVEQAQAANRKSHPYVTLETRQLFDSVLRTFSPVNQRVIKYRILGYGAGEICAILAEQNIDMNVNRVGVIYFNFKKKLRKNMVLEESGVIQ